MEYSHRLIDVELDELLPGLPALAIDGARGVGKTATAVRRAQTVFSLDDPAQRQIVAAEPGIVDQAARPVLLDEWQRHPPIWDHVRRQVDAGAAAGSYLLAGSAVPPDAPVHSGAGRIVSLRMRPLSIAERGLTKPTVSLTELLTGSRPEIGGSTKLVLTDYVEEIVASGFPGIRPLNGRSRRAQLDSYLARVVEREFPDQGLRIRRPQTLFAWLSAYAAATATSTSYNALMAAATPGETDKPAKTTTTAYRDVLDQLYLLDPVPGWIPSRNHLERLGQAPKLHLVDPALAARLLGVDAGALLRAEPAGPPVPRDGTLLGALFESLVTLSARCYAQVAEAYTRHLRMHSGAREIDLIIERADHRVVAIEVKLATTVEAGDVRHLLWLQDQLGDGVLDTVVVTTGANAYRRADGVAVVPAALLGP